MISDSELLDLNRKGFIPGPDENEETFLKRVTHLRQTCWDKLLSLKEPLGKDSWEKAHGLTKTLYDIEADWVPAFFSNKQLPFWQGAAAWTYETKEGVQFPVLQLKTSFKKNKHLGLYRIEEVLAHEAVHAARSPFNEPQFEELLAYRTSKSFFRRWFGPLFKTSKESYLFVFLLTIPLFVQIGRLWIEDNFFLRSLFILPWLALSISLLRLYRIQRTFSKCEKNLCSSLKNPDQSGAVLLRLTDSEILSLSKMAPQKLMDYVLKEKDRSLRWKLLFLAYFQI